MVDYFSIEDSITLRKIFTFSRAGRKNFLIPTPQPPSWKVKWTEGGGLVGKTQDEYFKVTPCVFISKDFRFTSILVIGSRSRQRRGKESELR